MRIEDYAQDFLKALIDDELEQFKGEENTKIRVFLEAMAACLDELSQASLDLARKRSLDGAEGVQLDGIGDIVKLTRAQSAMLSNEVTTDISTIDESVLSGVTTPTDLLERHAQYGIIPFDVIDDDRYREYLRYKIFLNSNHCTYPDLMKAIRMFWTKGPVTYSEDVDLGDGQKYHATILLDAGVVQSGQDARLFFLLPIIKAAGVMLIRKAMTITPMDPKTIHVGGAMHGCIMETTLPYMDKPEVRKEIHTDGADFGVATETRLPYINYLEE